MGSNDKIRKRSRVAIRIIAIILIAIFLLLIHVFIIGSNHDLPLELGQLVKGQLAANQIHSYHVKLAANKYIRISLTRQGGEASISLATQKNKTLVEMNGRLSGRASVSAISEGEEALIINVRAVTEIPTAYQLTIEENRSYLSSDRLKIEAEKCLAEAERLYRDGNSQKCLEAIEKYLNAANNWEQAGQLSEKAYALRKVSDIYSSLGKLEQALTSQQQSLESYKQDNNISGQADIYNDMSVVLLLKGERENAQESCMQAFYLRLELIQLADVISPWTPGRYRTPETATHHAAEVWQPDLAWCRERNLDFLPVTFPGFSWHNMKPSAPLDAIPRLQGRFFWSQVAGAKRAGAEMLYVAMFDEVDEGTAIFKVTNHPPVGDGVQFVTYEGLPSDHYLKLAGLAGKVIRGELPATDELPFPITQTQ